MFLRTFGKDLGPLISCFSGYQSECRHAYAQRILMAEKRWRSWYEWCWSSRGVLNPKTAASNPLWILVDGRTNAQASSCRSFLFESLSPAGITFFRLSGAAASQFFEQGFYLTGIRPILGFFGCWNRSLPSWCVATTWQPARRQTGGRFGGTEWQPASNRIDRRLSSGR